MDNILAGVIIGGAIGAVASIGSQLIVPLFNLLTAKRNEKKELNKKYLNQKTEVYKKISEFFFNTSSQYTELANRSLSVKEFEEFTKEWIPGVCQNIHLLLVENSLWLNDEEKEALNKLIDQFQEFHGLIERYMKAGLDAWAGLNKAIDALGKTRNFFDKKFKQLYQWEGG